MAIPTRLAGLALALALAPSAYTQTPGLQISNAAPQLESNIQVLVQLPDQTCESNPEQLIRFLPGIRRQIVRAGRALGYYYLSEQSQFTRGEDCWALEITLEPGDPVTIGSVDVNVATDADLFAPTLLELPIRKGDQLNHALYERSKSELSARAIELGFFAARFASSELQLDLQQNIAHVNIDFEPGERFQFGEVNIESIAALSEDFIRRYINFQTDSDYSASALIDLRNVLNDSFYFSNVTVTPSLEQAVDQRMPIQVGLQLRPRRVYSTGVGVTTDIGPRVRLDYEDRYVTRNGHQFDIRTAASPIQQLIDLEYAIPWSDPTTERLTFSGGFLHEDNDSFIAETTKIGASYSFLNPWGWRQNYFLNLQHDVSRISDKEEVSDMLIPGISVTRTRADDALYPQRGWTLFGQLMGSSDTLLSTETFLQLNVRGKAINPLGPGRVIVKFEAGTTVTDEISNLPASIQYFTGGDQSVRGYRYRSLAPLNEDGELAGGKNLLVGGIEYDFPILPNWKLALFADAGNAFSDFNDYELQKSVGIGVRWLSPLGPIRVDIASALDDDNKLRLHLTMGPDL
jgi:translocation and assembly module TamA